MRCSPNCCTEHQLTDEVSKKLFETSDADCISLVLSNISGEVLKDIVTVLKTMLEGSGRSDIPAILLDKGLLNPLDVYMIIKKAIKAGNSAMLQVCLS